MISLDELVLRLQRMGYRTQTFGDEIVLEFDKRSKLRGTREQFEKMLPGLAKHGVENRRRKTQLKAIKRARKTGKAKKRKGNIIVASAHVPTISAETRLGRFRGLRGKQTGAGLPSLGKRK